MKVLFLDIDGVLNSETYAKRYHEEHLGEKGYHIWVDPHAVELVRGLCEVEHVKIILSSSWRSYDLKSTIEHLTEYRHLKPLLRYIIGVTVSMMSRCRGEEIRRTIEDWDRLVDSGLIDKRYRDRGVLFQYAIVDDDSDMTNEQRPHFVQTDWSVGITEIEIERIKDILK